jgi:RHS repeat-associated protein
MLFTGEQRDSESDLYYLRARYYDPSIGRFLTQDPLRGWSRAPKTQNRYPYVMNSPANLRDPYGLCSFCDWVNDNVVDPVDDFFTGTVPETAETIDEFLASHPEIVLGVQTVSGYFVQTTCFSGLWIGCALSAPVYAGSTYLQYRYAGSAPEEWSVVGAGIIGMIPAPVAVTLVPNIVITATGLPVSPAHGTWPPKGAGLPGYGPRPAGGKE